MVRQLCVNILNDSATGFTLTEVRDYLVSNSRVNHVCTIDTGSSTMIRCSVPNQHTSGVISGLEKIGVGCGQTSWIDVIDLKSTVPKFYRPSVPKHKKEFRLHDRVTVEEIYETVDGGLHLTFDYLAMTTFAAVVCAIGLLTNSSVVVVSSMLLSPLMGPILGTCLGPVMHDLRMTIKGFRNEIIGIHLTAFVGFLFGFFVRFAGDDSKITSVEMLSRGNQDNLLAGFVVAFASGAALALSVTGESPSGFVGVALATAILPPITNAGVFLGLTVAGADYFHEAGISLALFIINWVSIIVASYIMFKIKKVSPSELHSGNRF
eukprot:c13554_g1_i1.p1 GENE.c13554_g1_i1~~c13554_g1_i1.p1  ORF type:complete len:321 (+),score=132.02 c13554_g1_i1:639-1601(+)